MSIDILVERYLAGDLNPEEHHAFAVRLEEDADLKRKVLDLQALDATLRAAGHSIDDVPLSPQLQALVDEMHLEGSDVQAMPPRANSVGTWISAFFGPRSPAMALGFGAAATACVVAVAVFGAGWFGPPVRPPVMMAGVNISKLADQVASGTQQHGVVFSGSFARADDDGICRVFQLVAKPEAQGLVCTKGADWTLVAYTQRPGSSYAPAGTDNDLIDAYVAPMTPLSQAQEDSFIAKRGQ